MFSGQALAEALRALGISANQSVHIAFSGGLDSSVLLHACACLRDAGQLGPVAAIHVHHGLQAQADDWVQQVQAFCAQHKVPVSVLRGEVCDTGAGPEAAARSLRYGLLEAALPEGDKLLFAHHCDDQAETFLLRALRGAGVQGLAAIPAARSLGSGQLLRPLLGFHRQQLEAYAQQHALDWVEDPSNAGEEFDRNFLRNAVMPLLRERWPAAGSSLARSAARCRASQQLIAGMAEPALQACMSRAGGLQIAALANLSEQLQAEVIRAWSGCLGYPVPDANSLRRIQEEVIPAREDAEPLVCWGGVELRRFRKTLYLSPPLLSLPESQPWRGEVVLELGVGVGRLIFVHGTGPGLSRALLEDRKRTGELQVGFRSGGERCMPAGRAGSQSLKKVLQEMQVAPWLRERVPLLMADGEIIAAGGLFYAQSCYADAPAETLQLRWQPDPAWSAPLEHASLLDLSLID